MICHVPIWRDSRPLKQYTLKIFYKKKIFESNVSSFSWGVLVVLLISQKLTLCLPSAEGYWLLSVGVSRTREEGERGVRGWEVSPDRKHHALNQFLHETYKSRFSKIVECYSYLFKSWLGTVFFNNYRF